MRAALLARLTLFTFLSGSLPLAAQTWRAIGPPGGDVRSLAQSPKNPSQLYLGTTDGHIFGSPDAGERWTLLGRISERSDTVVTTIIVDPRDSQRLYASAWTQEPLRGRWRFPER